MIPILFFNYCLRALVSAVMYGILYIRVCMYPYFPRKRYLGNVILLVVLLF
jgi:hypothetical protein